MTEEISALHIHDVIDDDPHFSIDPYTREITFTSEQPPILVENDHNSERFTFEIPKTVDGHDMTLCDVVEVHYINIDASTINHEKPTTSSSKYAVPIDEIKPKADDPDMLTFTWLIDGLATRYIGPLNFAVRFRCTAEVEETTTDEEGKSVTVIKTVDTYRFNTKPYMGVCVSEGMDVQLAMSDAYVDIVDQWQRAIDIYGESSETKIRQVYSEAVTEINNTITAAKTNAKNEIDDHVEEVVVETRKELAASALDAKDILVQTTGQATDKVMSQKATTDALNAKEADILAAAGVEISSIRSYVNGMDVKLQTAARYLHRYSTDGTGDHSGNLHTPTRYFIRSNSASSANGWGFSPAVYGVFTYARGLTDSAMTSARVFRAFMLTPGGACVSGTYGVTSTSNGYDKAHEEMSKYYRTIADAVAAGWTDVTAYITEGSKFIFPDYDVYTEGVFIRPLSAKAHSSVFTGGVGTLVTACDLDIEYEINGERTTTTIRPVNSTSTGDYFSESYTSSTGKTVQYLPRIHYFEFLVHETVADKVDVYEVREAPDGCTYTVDANGIATIIKTKTEGLVDTYTVTFDDGKTTTFTVTNGRAIASIDKTDTINDEDIYTVYFNDGTTTTFTVPNVEANRSYIEDNVEDLRNILEEFGATTNEQTTGLASVIDVPARVSKYARLNSFGGMSRKVAIPTAQGHNLLLFPYAGNNFGTDGEGTVALDPGVDVHIINADEPWIAPYSGFYKFTMNASDVSDCTLRIKVTRATDSGLDDVNAGGTDIGEYEVELVEGDIVTEFSYLSESYAITLRPAIYLGTYDTSSGAYVYYDDEWVPRVAQYKFEHTKLQAIKSVGANLIPYPYRESTHTNAGITYTNNNDGSVSVKGTTTATSYHCLSGGYGGAKHEIPSWLVPGKQYTISGGYTGGKGVVGVGLYLYGADGGNVFTARSTNESSGVVKFTMPEDAVYYGLFVEVFNNQTIDTVIYPMLNSGDTALPWEPYVEHIYTIPTDIPEADGFVAPNGTVYQDFVDVRNGKYIPKVYTKVFTGNEEWKQTTNYSDANVFSLYSQYVDKNGRAVAMITGVCNEYPTTTRSSEFGKVNGVYMATSSSYIITDMDCATLDDFKSKLKSRYAAGNPVVAKCVLWKEIEDPTGLPTRLDKLIPIEPNGHLIAVTNTGEEVPLDVEFTVIKDVPTVTNVYTKDEVDAMIAELTNKLNIISATIEEV